MKNPRLICTDVVEITYCPDCLRESSRRIVHEYGPAVWFERRFCEACTELTKIPLEKSLRQNLTPEQCAKAYKEIDECDGSSRPDKPSQRQTLAQMLQGEPCNIDTIMASVKWTQDERERLLAKRNAEYNPLDAERLEAIAQMNRLADNADEPIKV